MKPVTFREAWVVWRRIGVLGFGGPAGQIALMHRILVEEKKWIDESRFLHALNYCMLLPGPEAQQLAIYVGWILHGVRGGLVAGILFILPGAAIILALSWLYVLFGNIGVVEGLFFGLKAAVLAIVFQALLRIAKRAVKGSFLRLLAAGGFLALFVFRIPFPLVVLAGGIAGALAGASGMRLGGGHGPSGTAESGTAPEPPPEPAKRSGVFSAAAVCLLLWCATIASLYLLFGGENVFTRIAVFFSKVATVTFGGAYAVLAYVGQQAVENRQWLLPGEMLDGLGMAETTPGPLILVTQFVGFLAAYRHSGLESTLLAGTLGAMLTTWVIFLPSFFWIFAGAPYAEKLYGNRAFTAALSGITAVVVGVIANLALWFATHILFQEHVDIATFGTRISLPSLPSIQWPILALTALAFVLAFPLKVRLFPLLGITAAAGCALHFLV